MELRPARARDTTSTHVSKFWLGIPCSRLSICNLHSTTPPEDIPGARGPRKAHCISVMAEIKQSSVQK